MATLPELAQAGDALQQLCRRALQALMDDDPGEALRILDADAWAVHRRWDQARGRPVPSDAEVEEGRRALAELAADLERSLR